MNSIDISDKSTQNWYSAKIKQFLEWDCWFSKRLRILSRFCLTSSFSCFLSRIIWELTGKGEDSWERLVCTQFLFRTAQTITILHMQTRTPNVAYAEQKVSPSAHTEIWSTYFDAFGENEYYSSLLRPFVWLKTFLKPKTFLIALIYLNHRDKIAKAPQ